MRGSFDASVEHYPMSGLDEFLIHNHPHPVRVMWTSDVQAYERMWFTCQDTTGDLLVVAGMGIYPEPRNGRGLRHRQRPGRSHHGAGPPQARSQSHPTCPSDPPLRCGHPVRQWQLTLDENDYGIAFDLSWFDTKRPVYRLIGGGLFTGTRPFAGVAGYDGFGRQSGWVVAHDERFALKRTAHHGVPRPPLGHP